MHEAKLAMMRQRLKRQPKLTRHCHDREIYWRHSKKAFSPLSQNYTFTHMVLHKLDHTTQQKHSPTATVVVFDGKRQARVTKADQY